MELYQLIAFGVALIFIILVLLKLIRVIDRKTHVKIAELHKSNVELAYELHSIKNLVISRFDELSILVEQSSVKAHLSPSEMARLEREEQFEERILRLKEEISQKNETIRTGTQAVEFHPGVKNLPHNIIPNTKDTLPDVEYTE